MDAQNVIVWTCIIIFILTAGITFLALLGLIKLGGGTGDKHHYFLTRLFYALLIEVATVSISVFGKSFIDNSDQLRDLTTHVNNSAPVPLDLPKDTLSTEVSSDSLITIKPGKNPEFKTVTDTITASVYATTDDPKSTSEIISIPEGSLYAGHETKLWTKNGKFSEPKIELVQEGEKVVAVKINVEVGDRKIFGPRNWIGAKLKVFVEKRVEVRD